MKDAFSAYHPWVNFLFFAGAIGCGVVFQHPAFLLVSILCALAYYLLLGGRKSLKAFLVMLPVALCLAAVNPLFNLRGEHILFYVFGRPYTWEALLYGCAMAGILLTMLLHIGCWGYVLTSDKFTTLFGNLIPSISLLLVMVLRMVPSLLKKAQQILGARAAIGKGISGTASTKEKLSGGMAALGSLTSWALEGSIVTADSMRARGYGSAKRSSFLIYRMTLRDWVLTAVQLLLLAFIILSACLGQTDAAYTPEISLAPLSWGIVLYGIFLFIPLTINIKEAIVWRILRSKL